MHIESRPLRGPYLEWFQKYWPAKFSEDRIPAEERPFVGNTSGDYLSLLLQDYDQGVPSCEADEVRAFCGKAYLPVESYLDSGPRKVAWLDDRSWSCYNSPVPQPAQGHHVIPASDGPRQLDTRSIKLKATATIDDSSQHDTEHQNTSMTKDRLPYRKYDAPLSAAQLFDHLKQKRFGHVELPDADRRLIYVPNLAPQFVIALTETAPAHQVPALRDAIFKHLALRTSLSVKICARNYSVFQLEFNMPFYALRTCRPKNCFQDGIYVKPERKWRDISFLGNAMGNDIGIHEAHISFTICGRAESQWVAYAFVDTDFDEDRKMDKDKSDDTDMLVDQLALDREVDANRPIWNPREYFLLIVSIRLEQAVMEWARLVRVVEKNITQYTEERPFLREAAGSRLHEDETKATFDWIQRTLSMLRHLLKLISKTNEAWARFSSPGGDVGYFSDLDNMSKASREHIQRSLLRIREKFEDLEDLQWALKSLEKQCQESANVLQSRLAIESNWVAILNGSASETMIAVISPPMIVSTIFAIPEPFGTFRRTAASFVFITLLVFAALQLILYLAGRGVSLQKHCFKGGGGLFRRYWSKAMATKWMPLPSGFNFCAQLSGPERCSSFRPDITLRQCATLPSAPNNNISAAAQSISRASSGRAIAPENTDCASRQECRWREEDKKCREEPHCQLAIEIVKQEEEKKVRPEFDRTEARVQARGEYFASKSKESIVEETVAEGREEMQRLGSMKKPTTTSTTEENFDDKQGIQSSISTNAKSMSKESADIDKSDDNEDTSSEDCEVANGGECASSEEEVNAEYPTSEQLFSSFKKNLHGFLHPTSKADESEGILQKANQSNQNNSEDKRCDVAKSTPSETQTHETVQVMHDEGNPLEEIVRPLLQGTRSRERSFIVPQRKVREKNYHFLSSLPLLVDTILQNFRLPQTEPPVPEGKVRARWKCRCGARLFDDFTELEPGSVKELERELQDLNHSAGRTQNFMRIMSEGLEALWKPIEHRLQKRRPSNSNRGNMLPLEEIRQRCNAMLQSNVAGQNNQTSAGCQDTLHLLLCIDKGNSGTPLQQAHLKGVSTDRELFSFLQSEYFAHWNVRPWFTLRNIESLSLSRFALDFSNFAEVHKHTSICGPTCVCLPPVDRLGKEYCCRPAPEVKPKYEPAIGSQRLTHYFRSPQCVDTTQQTILAQLPKKVGHLRALNDQEEIGWGIHFQEGWHWRTVYLIGVLLIALFSLAFGIAWSIMKGDIQAAFSISCFCLTLGSLLVGCMALRSK